MKRFEDLSVVSVVTRLHLKTFTGQALYLRRSNEFFQVSISYPSGEGGGYYEFLVQLVLVIWSFPLVILQAKAGGHTIGQVVDSELVQKFPLVLLQAKAGGRVGQTRVLYEGNESFH